MGKSDDNGAGARAERGRPELARKHIVGLSVLPDRRAILIRARGPLDIADTEIEMAYCQLKHMAGQFMTQEAELEIAAIAGLVKLD